MDLKLHDVVELKKEHPCGSRRWEVLRVGMDIRLRCAGCGHEVLAPRRKVEKSIKRVIPKAMGVALLMAIVMLLGLIIPYIGL